MEAKPVILVVDDQPQNIELLEAYLVPQGYEIVKVASGEEALEKLSGNHIDLVLLDVMMPGMNGFEVIRRVRQDNALRLLPIILVTALRDTQDRVDGINVGCDDFISKPVDKMELLARVQSLLRIKSLHGEVVAAREYAESIINTVREPLIALDQDLRVVSVSRSFYEVFKGKPEETVGKLIYDLGNKQWDIPKLRELLETILPQETTFDNYEVEHDFSTIGRRIVLLNARQIQRVLGKERIILLAIEDITERKGAEEALAEAAKEREKLVKELQYALDNIKTLQGLIPMCSNCKKIRDDKGFWNQVEGYIMAHSDARFTHGVCPECAKKLYGDLYDKVIENQNSKTV
jgi:PAS domain S-box-containing protein